MDSLLQWIAAACSALLVACLVSVAARAAPTGREFQSAPGRHTHLVELFSSEGCSSCPPAERWMTTLKDAPGLWTEFVPVEFHVDYWNRLGWNDRFSKEAFTAREWDYAREWKRESVYTPARVRDGREWEGEGWGNWPAAPLPGQLRARESGGPISGGSARDFDVEYDGSPGAALEIHAVLLGRGLSSEVTAGENAGRTLQHEFVALSYVHAAIPKGAKGAHLSLPAPPATAHPESLAVAFWVSREGSPTPLQAAGGSLGRMP